MTAFRTPDGFRLLPGWFDRENQARLVNAVLARLLVSPLYRPAMPRSGAPLSVEMTNFGALGWVADQVGGYRYEQFHPKTGAPWPDIPEALLSLWMAVSNWPDSPQACLVNWYAPGARMGLHIDRDEEAVEAPVLSVSLGDKALFRIGGPKRGDPTASLTLSSGDVVVLGGRARRCFHGVDRIYPGTSSLLPDPFRPGRINLTLRRVRRSASIQPRSV